MSLPLFQPSCFLFLPRSTTLLQFQPWWYCDAVIFSESWACSAPISAFSSRDCSEPEQAHQQRAESAWRNGSGKCCWDLWRSYTNYIRSIITEMYEHSGRNLSSVTALTEGNQRLAEFITLSTELLSCALPAPELRWLWGSLITS